jgi:hypothetical protein
VKNLVGEAVHRVVGIQQADLFQLISAFFAHFSPGGFQDFLAVLDAAGWEFPLRPAGRIAR